MPLIPLLASLIAMSGLPIAGTDDPASADPRIDAKTGRQVGVWPLARHFDHIDMSLELTFPDIGKATLIGHERLVIAAIGSPRQVVSLVNNGPVISTVRADGQPCTFTQTGKSLNITLPRAVEPGASTTLDIEYELDFSKNRGEGLTYSKANPDSSSLTRQVPQIHAQGQAELNSRWFPCHDFPNDKLTTRIIVHVQEGFDVISNGHLVSRGPSSKGTAEQPLTRWEWFQDKPHSPYLVTLVIGKFARIDLGGPQSARPGLDIPVFTPWGTEERVASLYSKTPAMMAFFEQLFDEPYPWDQYAQCIVRDFNAGGMENTSCTLMTTGSTRGEDGSQDDLIAHELAHQWFGDLVTCNSWAHIWLNEGWASFAEALWKEHEAAKDGEDKATTAYQRTVRGFFQSQRFRNKSSWPQYTPMVSNRYSDPDSLFSRPEDPYAKGAMLLHMLRQRIGDNAFFAGTRAYLDKFRFQTAETDDFRREMEAASGQSLERFFDQWAYRPGLPRLSVELNWDESAKSLGVSLSQTQTVDANNPAFVFSLPIRVKFDDDTTAWVELDVAGKTASGSFPFDRKPKQVSIDPRMSIMAASEITKDIAWWMDELAHPASYHALASATEALMAIRQSADRTAAAKADAALTRLLTRRGLPRELAMLIEARTSTAVASH
jgi:aminopeptidase N